ncbi:hypothetical protein J1C56_08795 [Aminobacter anthyllidis]|uniref:Uncharacterized protein n=1 Tax=Aminobacter anthyllidis TaxID=1035067 RepID=A0A9X1D5F3_9HYPH|nr:hypothetical protein [Aminobacter anthyllidis]MBT1155689.1 hypothetical protein [Aminobacter anthyllidis]
MMQAFDGEEDAVELNNAQTGPIGEGEFVSLNIRAVIPWEMRLACSSHDVRKTLQLKTIQNYGSIYGGKRDLRLGLNTQVRVFLNRIYPRSDYRREHELSSGWNKDGFSFEIILNEYDDAVFGELRSAPGKVVEIDISTQGWKANVLGTKSLYVEGYVMNFADPEPEPKPEPKPKRRWPFS